MKTYNDLYLDNKHILTDFGSTNAQFEARQILAYAADKSVSQILANKNLYVNNEVEARNNELLNKLTSGMPLPYVLESWEFYGLPFHVNSDVLIPRIDTEVLIDTIKQLYPDLKCKIRILDLCTGSGNIACTLAHEYPNSYVTAIDISEKALNVAKRNIQNLNLSAQITCIHSDITRSADSKLGKFDIIVSNPPYIKSSEIDDLETSVKDYEPRLALDGGQDGYDFYHSIINNYTCLLKDDGCLAFEVGENQAKYISKLIIDAGYKSSETRKDTVGTERVVIGRK